MAPRVAKRERSLNIQAELLLRRKAALGGLAPEYQEALEAWAYHPWNFLTANDPQTDEPLIWTRDERDKIRPIKPFPIEEYLYWIIDAYLNERLVVIQKSRQMYVSTLTCLFMLWQCLFTDARRWLLSKVTEDDAKEILRDKIRYPYGQLPDWFKQLYPASITPEARMDFGYTKSYIQAVAENVADREARGGTGSIFVDEAAFQREYPRIWSSALPMAAQMIVVSTPELGNPGARFMRRQCYDELE